MPGDSPETFNATRTSVEFEDAARGRKQDTNVTRPYDEKYCMLGYGNEKCIERIQDAMQMQMLTKGRPYHFNNMHMHPLIRR